jgi:hypothetical protein
MQVYFSRENLKQISPKTKTLTVLIDLEEGGEAKYRAEREEFMMIVKFDIIFKRSKILKTARDASSTIIFQAETLRSFQREKEGAEYEPGNIH